MAARAKEASRPAEVRPTNSGEPTVSPVTSNGHGITYHQVSPVGPCRFGHGCVGFRARRLRFRWSGVPIQTSPPTSPPETWIVVEGRPLRRRGRLMVGHVPVCRARSVLRIVIPGIDARRRAILASHWRRLAELEHASIVAFEQLRGQLARLDAPDRLLEGLHPRLAARGRSCGSLLCSGLPVRGCDRHSRASTRSGNPRLLTGVGRHRLAA